VAFTGDHLAFRADRPMEAEPLSSPDDKLSVFECVPFLWQTLCTVAWESGSLTALRGSGPVNTRAI